MNKFILLLLPVVIFAANFNDILKGVDENLLVKSKEKKSEALEELYLSSKGKNYPSIDISINAIKLRDTPSATFALVPGMPPSQIEIGVRDNYSYQIGFTYPIFTGFAITNTIKKAKLEVIKSKLETKNLKRELYLKAASLYSAIYSINQAIKATKVALKAIDLSYNKAKGLYENGLLNQSGVYNIEAKRYDTVAKIKELEAKKDRLNNALFQISGKKVASDFKLPEIKNIQSRESIIQKALSNREDIKAIKEELHISQSDIDLANSLYYPKVALVGALKREGKNLRFNGDGHTNPDKSYIGINFSWNIFDGFSKKHKKEAAIKKKEALVLYLKNYENVVKNEINDLFIDLKSLKYRLIAAKKSEQAKEEYLKLTKSRFENSLASADELTRAIADLASAKAKAESIRADIFRVEYRLVLELGIKS